MIYDKAVILEDNGEKIDKNLKLHLWHCEKMELIDPEFENNILTYEDFVDTIVEGLECGFPKIIEYFRNEYKIREEY